MTPERVRDLLPEAAEAAVVDLGMPNEPRLAAEVYSLVLNWAVPYWGGDRWLHVLVDPKACCVRPLALAAGCYRNSIVCAEHWNDFVNRTSQDVEQQPWPAFLLHVAHPQALLVEIGLLLNSLLKQQLEDSHVMPPWASWLWDLYVLTHDAFHASRPGALPDWWSQVLGGPPLVPPPPISSLPAAGFAMPTSEALDRFIEEESQGESVLRDILWDLSQRPTPIRINGNWVSSLEFCYLRYRPVANAEGMPTPENDELLAAFSAGGAINARNRPFTAGCQRDVTNLTKILSRIRRAVVDRLDGVIHAGRLHVSASWPQKAFPRPNLYVYGRLFPRVTPSQP